LRHEKSAALAQDGSSANHHGGQVIPRSAIQDLFKKTFHHPARGRQAHGIAKRFAAEILIQAVGAQQKLVATLNIQLEYFQIQFFRSTYRAGQRLGGGVSICLVETETALNDPLLAQRVVPRQLIQPLTTP
jgi:hypothetical protein